MRRLPWAALLLLAFPPAGRAGPSLDALARLLSPDFRAADDRRAALRREPPDFRPPPSRSPYLGYDSRAARAADNPRWVQVDLGAPRPIDTVVLVPAAGPGGAGTIPADGGARRFRP